MGLQLGARRHSGHHPQLVQSRLIARHYYAICVGSSSTPLFDTVGSVHRLRFQQHGLRSPLLSFEHATSIRRLRVSCRLVARIQRIHSQRAIGVTFFHRACASGTAARALIKSAGTSGSGHSFIGSISSDTSSPALAPAPLSRRSSTLNQWLHLPSGSSGV